MTKKRTDDMPAAAIDHDKQIILKRLPRALHSAVKIQAIENQTTAQIVVLQALKDAGLPVPDELLIPHRRRVEK